ncbi:MAG: holo-ACP synthase [Phycisphaerae bacterium]|nr:holo-ACP synthase [Phycisphaerae bacterium]MDZ4831358.1 holo-ACP synthase [Phycisphaerae bacterium]
MTGASSVPFNLGPGPGNTAVGSTAAGDTGVGILGHGVDLVENSRIAAMLEAHGDHFTERCFTVTERAYADHAVRQRVERYAVRFAAKEAVLKALGTGWTDGIAWTEMEVLRLATGEPRLLLSGRAQQIAAERGIVQWWLSMSHSAHYSIASAIASGGPSRRSEAPKGMSAGNP